MTKDIIVWNCNFLVSNIVAQPRLNNADNAGKSTVTALLTTTHEWFQQLEEGKEICAVFFGFKKAFDSVPHRPLITKLQQMGVPYNLLVWISSYLANSSQKVVVNGATSESMPALQKRTC